ITDKVLKAGWLDGAGKKPGKFRNLLVKSLNNYANTQLGREFKNGKKTQRFDEEGQLPPSPEVVCRFDQEWVRQVMLDAVRMMEESCGGTYMWKVFQARYAGPLLNGEEPLEYLEIVKRCGISTPRKAQFLLAHAVKKFRDCFRTAVGKYVETTDEI